MGLMVIPPGTPPPVPREDTTPTLHDVAAAAGVSVMTASRVLSGTARVRQEKAKLVLDAVSALGYRRNENARSLRPGQRTGLIGVVITNASNPYYAEMQLGVEEELAKNGMRMLIGNSGDDTDRERLLVQDFVGWHVDGLVLVPSGSDARHLNSRALDGKPIVLASRRLPGLEVDTVLIDDVGGSREGTARLLTEGHRRIAFIGHNMSVRTSERRFAGFRQAHEDAGVDVDDRLVQIADRGQDSSLLSARALLRQSDAPTAVFSANNRNTIAVMHAMNERRSQDGTFPDIRVVAFDNFDTADLMPVHLSVIDHDARELGRRAAGLLIARLDPGGASTPPVTVELQTRLLL